MNKLPSELFTKIFILLPQKTKLECALVCHQWTYAALQCLYDHVLINNKRKLDQFMNSVNYEPARKLQLNHISIFEPHLFNFDKRKLCHLFPNLQSVRLFKFNFSKPYHDISIPDTYSSTTDLKSRIKSLIENGTSDFILYLIEGNLCDQLERLHLSNNSAYGQRYLPLHLLKNMPSLKMLNLGLHSGEITLLDAEIIHENIPSITDFQFFGAKLMQRNVSPILGPNPTIKSTTWNFRSINDYENKMERYIECLQYIAKKYSCLEKLSISVNETVNFSFEEREKIFEHGWLPLLQSIGYQLQKIGSINIPENINIFQTLDNFNCKTQDLSIVSTLGTLTLKEFAQSNQRNYIQRLCIKNMAISSNIFLKDTKLVELELIFSSHNSTLLNLIDFLKTCPNTLKSLILENASVNYDGFESYQCISITHIDINKDGTIPIDNEIEEKVRKCCPNLKHLRLLNT